ncbi:MAG: hypothetical protein J7623_24835 [Chitinophaga sp.]|uniref:hypothetical protein n=1 Tax=Chitinophaga sp. TaxID=1869181 RepID=UPI001B0DD136|nr:hypothetical protein [Chitinophaga sp.]MBO9731891.1 hypothetical protein [Chitinophaga sp.]
MSVEINISNYESYLLSYIDGELNEVEQAALELFLQKHPQFKQELELLEGVKIVPDETIVFDNKAALYKTTTADTVDYEELMLGYIDGELSVEEARTLQVYLAKHPAAQQDLLLLQATKLTPDTKLVFKDKASLYRSTARKTSPIYRRIGWSAAVAAAVAGLIIWLLPAGHHTQQPPAMAVNTPTTVNTPSVTNTPSPATHQVAAEPVAVPDVANKPKEASQVAKSNKTVITREKEPAVASVPDKDLATTNTPKADVPVMSQLPPQRNAVDELVEQHLQQAENAHIAAVKPEATKEPLLASNTKMNDNASQIAAATTATPGVQGELIMSVSGSDSKILDKVTNVAKLFSRKRNK